MKFLDVAWDFDGTLYNSYPHIIHCLTLALNSYGVTDDPETVERAAHVNLGYAFSLYAPRCGCSEADLAQAYRNQVIAAGCSSRVVPYEGIPELLREIFLAGGRNYICSNRGEDGCRMYLERDGLAGYFSAYACPDSRDGLRSKPEPDLFLHLAEQQGLLPEEILMIGDRNLDIDAAHAAGGKGCFFDPDGFATVTCDPEYFAPDIDALCRILLG